LTDSLIFQKTNDKFGNKWRSFVISNNSWIAADLFLIGHGYDDMCSNVNSDNATYCTFI